MKKVLICLLIIMVLTIGIYKILNRDNSIDSDYVIVDKNENCIGEKEKFYEDSNYIYKFKCEKSNDITLEFEEGATYELVYALKHHLVTIDSLQEHGLDFIREKK